MNRLEFRQFKHAKPFPAAYDYCCFYPSASWGIVVPFVCRRTHSFGYYTNMVRQIKFILHTNIQPLPALFFTQGQGQIFKKNLVNAIT